MIEFPSGFETGLLRFISTWYDQFVTKKLYITCYKTPLTWKHSREALEHVLTNVLELKSESTDRKTLTQNAYECIEDLVNITDADIPDLSYPTDTKTVRPHYKGYHNLIRIFGAYFQYQIHDNDPIGDSWVNFTNDNFNKFHLKGYCGFRRLCMSGIVNTRATSTTSSTKPYHLVDNFKRSIKCGPKIFNAFKGHTLWENCNHTTTETACAQEVEGIFMNTMLHHPLMTWT